MRQFINCIHHNYLIAKINITIINFSETDNSLANDIGVQDQSRFFEEIGCEYKIR